MFKRIYTSNSTLILALVPLFLIISSSVYPTILTTIDNRERLVVAEALAQLQGPSDKEDTSSHHADIGVISSSSSPSSTPTVASPISIASSNKNEFTTMAALQNPIIRLSNDIVNKRANYDIGFFTTTAGVIKTIEMVFPPDTISSNSLVEFSGIGTGLLTRPASNSLLYTVFTPVNVPANTPIRFEVGFFNNPTSPTTTATAQITTKDTGGSIIDGPTNSAPYTIRQIATSDIEDNAVTTGKIADGNVGTNDIADNAVTTPKIADNAVTTPKIADNAITAAKIQQDLVHVVWRDNTPGNDEILYRRDGGGFDPSTINLSSNPGSSIIPAIAVSGSNVYVVWSDSSDILFRKSTDGGGTFGGAINLSNTPGGSQHASIAVSGNNVYVVWSDVFEILYRRSTDGGANFEPTVNLSNNAGSSELPSVAASGNNVYVVWRDSTPGNNEILYRRSTDGGANFEPTVNLSNNAGGSGLPISGLPIAASGNNVYVVWEDNTPGNNEILYRRSTDGGANFEPTVNLSNNAGSSLNSSIAGSGSNAYAVWQDTSLGNIEIFYRMSTDGGINFDPAENLSNNAQTSLRPSIAVSANNVYVVWDDVILSNNEILYRRSTDGGASFEPFISNLSNNAGFSIEGSVAALNPQI